MVLIVRNQQNNWSYVLVIALIAALIGWWTVDYANDTIEEINRLSEVDFEQQP